MTTSLNNQFGVYKSGLLSLWLATCVSFFNAHNVYTASEPASQFDNTLWKASHVINYYSTICFRGVVEP